MEVFGDLGPVVLAVAAAVAVFAGVVKGAVGFAMPILMVSGLSLVLPLNLALAALVVPTMVTNLLQAVRGGLPALVASARDYWRLIVTVLGMILLSAQLVTVLPSRVLYLMIGIPVSLYAISQLLGRPLTVPAKNRNTAQWITGLVGGFFGGFSGVWGPPVVALLTALNTPKAEQVRVQGIVYGMGSVMFALAHIRSGVITGYSMPLSVALLLPTLIGLSVGFYLQDRMDQDRFRKATMAVLLFAALNLIRRGLF